MTKKITIKNVEEKILKVAIELAKKGEGALFVIGNKVGYEKLLKQRFEPFSIFDSGAEKLLKSLAIIDGAMIINPKGGVVDYGAMIKKSRAFIGYGTRHAAAITASKNNSTSILCSEEEHKVKIFKNGKYIMQVDALQKNVEKQVSRITTLLESLGAGLVGTIGAATLAPTLGVALIPGVLVFGGSYLAIKSIIERIKK
ncbi:MAG: DNA integrity scanning protein DisA nucleotide-binding domain protein [archaeon]